MTLPLIPTGPDGFGLGTERPDPDGPGGDAPARYGAQDIAAALGMPRPTAQQQAVVEAPLRPLLVVAGAGSGKTETMAARVVWLVANRLVEPDQVLGLTFTRKAAGELAERVARRLRGLQREGLWEPEPDPDGTPGLPEVPTVSTYHAYAGRLVDEHGLRVGVEPHSRLLSEAAAWQLAHEAVLAHDEVIGGIDGPAESSLTSAVMHLAGELAEHLRTPADLGEHAGELLRVVNALPSVGRIDSPGDHGGKLVTSMERRAALVPVLERYARLKHERSALDFADQMAIAARLATGFPAVGRLERRRFRAVLLDEFQDTSEAQLVLLHALFGGDDPAPVMAVGDPHQSIYGWRGASATTLQAFRERFGGPGGVTVLPLSTSWRNDAAVLAAANHAAAPLRDGSPVPVEPLGARPGAGPGSVHAERLLTVEDEAGAVARWVHGHWFDDEGEHTGATAAVLCRKRSQFPALVEALTAAGLPVEVVGIGGLLSTPEVGDLVALLWVVQDPTRGDRLMRLLVGPQLRLGPADLDGLSAWAGELHRRYEVSSGRDPGADRLERDRLSVVEALEELPPPGWQATDGRRLGEPARERLARLAQVVTRLRMLTGLPLTELLHEAERALGLDVEVLARPEHTPATARVHLDAFADVAARFAASAERTTLGGFLDWLAAAEQEERGLELGTLESETDAVQVLTVHAAKGLEWDAVAVPGLVEGSFPAHGSRARPDKAGPGWRIGEGRPDDPSSWAVSDSGWLTGLDSLPYELRGDAAGLPELRWRWAGDLARFRDAVAQFRADAGAHAVAEERRLAYVALTRARTALLLTSAVWADGSTPRLPSRFLLELTGAGLCTTGTWTPMPDDPKPVNPRDALAADGLWPHDPLGRRREQLAAGAAAVRGALGELGDQDVIPVDEEDSEVFVLLAERERRRARRDPVVLVPRHLAASAVVALAQDPAAFAAALRRPMPQAPALAARRGTAFHAWIEQHYAQAALVDLDEMPGAADPEPADDEQLPVMKQHFLDSPWASRVPQELEVPVETVVDGFAVRGRIDAVFPAEPGDGGEAGDDPQAAGDGPAALWTIVDWKTGRPPTGETASARLMQLAAYRVAYARLRGVDPQQVRAAFFHAATGETLWPRLPGEDELARLLGTIPG